MEIRPSLLCFLLGFFVGRQSFGQVTSQMVKISNLNNVKGDLYMGWYKDDATFRVNSKAVHREKIQISNQSEVSVTFSNIPKGKYAIAVFLDENGNYKLDNNLLGIPKEKYGFSNNILLALRPATFAESAFDIQQGGMGITICLK
jgi:uncharacterized protein (DUF2141 family)